MNSAGNEFLIVRNTVKLTPIIEPVICSLEEYFRKAGLISYVTSGLRNADDQIRIIRNELMRRKLHLHFQEAFHPDLKKTITWEGKLVYSWQPAWSKLLNAGFIVNPPYEAACLLDYYRPGSKVNKRGQLIGQTPHARGTAFDIGGGADGISQETAVIKQAIKDKVPGLKGVLPERNNNAIHVDCSKI